MKPVSTEIQDDVGLVCIDNPPVNAAGQAVRQGLLNAFNTLEASEQVKVIAVYCAGRAGACRLARHHTGWRTGTGHVLSHACGN